MSGITAHKKVCRISGNPTFGVATVLLFNGVVLLRAERQGSHFWSVATVSTSVAWRAHCEGRSRYMRCPVLGYWRLEDEFPGSEFHRVPVENSTDASHDLVRLRTTLEVIDQSHKHHVHCQSICSLVACPPVAHTHRPHRACFAVNQSRCSRNIGNLGFGRDSMVKLEPWRTQPGKSLPSSASNSK